MKPSHLIIACILSAFVWMGIGGLAVITYETVTAQEDDPLANCWVYGDHNCGAHAPWHGYVNGFKHADER